MPYTLAHPAFALPLRRLRLPASALAIGAMTPDAPLWMWFIGLGEPFERHVVSYDETHSLVGILTWCLLFGLVGWATWTALLRGALRDALPAGLRSRVPSPPGFTDEPSAGDSRGRLLVLAAAGVVVGATTHVLLDEFTHTGRWGTTNLLWLAESYGGRSGADWLQLVFTGAGLIALAAAIVCWLASVIRRDPHRHSDGAPLPRIVMRAGLGVSAVAACAVVFALWGGGGLFRLAYLFATTGVFVFLIGVVILAVGHRAITMILIAGEPDRRVPHLPRA